MDCRHALAMVFFVLMSGSAAWGEAASPPPPARGLSSSAVTTAEEPRGVLSLRDVLRLALLRNPELSAFTYERRAAEARELQAGILPNPSFSAELENVAGTGSTTKDVRSAETTLQLSQFIELGGKRAKRLRLAGV